MTLDIKDHKKNRRVEKLSGWKKDAQQSIDTLETRIGKLETTDSQRELSDAKTDLQNWRFVLQNMQAMAGQVQSTNHRIQELQDMYSTQHTLIKGFLGENELLAAYEEYLVKKRDEAEAAAKAESEAEPVAEPATD